MYQISQCTKVSMDEKKGGAKIFTFYNLCRNIEWMFCSKRAVFICVAIAWCQQSSQYFRAGVLTLKSFFGCRCRMRRPSLSMYVKLFGALNLGIHPSSAVQQVLQHQCDSWGSSRRCRGSHFKVDFIHCPSTGRAQQRSTFPPLFIVDLHFS